MDARKRRRPASHPPAFPDVTVLLGDPRLPDASKPGGRYTPEDLEAVERLREALATLGEYRFEYVDDHAGLMRRLASRPPTFILNFCDTGYRNQARYELHVPALLELLAIPYSGAGPVCLGLCYDKPKVRVIAADLGVPVPAETLVEARALARGEVPPHALPHPVLVKPATGDGSVGITAASVARSDSELEAALMRLSRELPGSDAVIQEFLPGSEYAIGLIGNPETGFTALPPLEVDYDSLDPALPRILAFESKTVAGSPYWTQLRYREARLDEATRARLVEVSAQLFQRLDCRDYARFDFRADPHGEVRLLEVNPNPAWCWDGKMNLMAGFAGLDYSEFLRALLDASQGRIGSARADSAGGAPRHTE